MQWLQPLIPFHAATTDVHATNCTSSVLNLRTLTILKWKDDQGTIHRYNVISSICHKWCEIGTVLGLDFGALEAISLKNSKDPKSCCMDVIKKWQQDGSQYYPFSWEGLLDLLEDTQELATVISKLRNALDRNIASSSD